MFSFSSWIDPSNTGNVSFFSFSCGLSSSVAQIINLKAENLSLQANIWAENKNPPEIVLAPILRMTPNQFKFTTPKCIFVSNFILSSFLVQLGQNLAFKLHTIG